MKATISNVHDSHGAVFTLNLPKSAFASKTFATLKQLLSYLAMHSASHSLYSYGIEIDKDRINISLTEGRRSLANVEGLWNPKREDQRFVVLIAEGDPRNNPTVNPGVCPHFTCHVCGLDTYGVNRDTLEVYEKTTNSIRRVSVHYDCKFNRLREIETTYAEA